MKKTYRSYIYWIGLVTCGLILSENLEAARIQTTGTPHPLVKEMVDTIVSKGQDAVCVPSGVFRKSVKRPGSLLPVAGGNCQSTDFYNMALVVCGGYKDQNGKDFEDSTCGKIGSSSLGYKKVEDAKNYLIQAIKDRRTDAVYLACHSPQDKLVRGLKEVALAACEEAAPARPTTTAPTTTTPTQTPEAAPTGRKRSAGVTGVTPAILAVRAKLQAAAKQNVVYLDALKLALTQPQQLTPAGKVTIGGGATGVPAVTIPEVKTKKDDLLKAAEDLSAAMKNLNAALDADPANTPQEQEAKETLKFKDDIAAAPTEEDLLKELQQLKEEWARIMQKQQQP